MKAAEWIDRVKAERGWDSDYRVAKELGVGRSAVSRYRSDPESTMDDAIAAKVAALLDIEPEIVVIDQVAERTPVAVVRAGVTRLLERIGGKARAGGGAGARKGPVDITSAASTAPGEDPARGSTNAIRPEYTSHHRRSGTSSRNPVAHLVQWLSAAAAPAPRLAAAR